VEAPLCARYASGEANGDSAGAVGDLKPRVNGSPWHKLVETGASLHSQGKSVNWEGPTATTWGPACLSFSETKPSIHKSHV